jgi:hypothetical protein
MIRMVACPLLLIALGLVGFIISQSLWPSQASAAPAGAYPVLEYQNLVELGEREWGELAIARFSLANRGNRELLLDQFRTNCSCSALQTETDGKLQPVKEVRLGPHQRTYLVLRVSVRGQAGEPMLNVVHFRTNDPAQPHGALTAKVARIRGGVETFQAVVAFGAVLEGDECRRTVEVRDRSSLARRVVAVQISNPELLEVKLLPLLTESQTDQQPSEGALIGRIEAAVNTAKATPIEGTIHITLDDPQKPPLKIDVHGRIVPVVELIPSVVVLPRRSAQGWSHSAEVRCRNARGMPLGLHLQEVPAELAAWIEYSNDDPSACTLRIECRPDLIDQLGASRRFMLKLRAWTGDAERELTIPILWRKQEVSHERERMESANWLQPD